MDESVGSNSWKSSAFHGDDGGGGVVNCPFPSPPPRQQQQQQQQRIKDGDVCFACQQKGHWAKDCPSKTNNNSNKKKKNATIIGTSSSISTSTTNGDDPDEDGGVDLMCPCGAGCCNILTSKTALNPNRNFYRCPLYGAKACRFFKWCDEVFLITGPPPACPCGAGLSCVVIQQNHRRSSYLFVCPIKKGQGACNFIQPVDAATYSKGEASMSCITSSSPKSPLSHCFSGDTTTRPSSSSSSSSTISDKIIVEDESSDISFQVPESESSVSGTPQQRPSPIQLETSCRVPWDDEMRKLMNFQEQEEEDSPGEGEEEVEESPLRHHHHKHLRDGDPKNDDVFVHDSYFNHNCADLEEVPCTDTLAIRASVSVLTSGRVLVHHQQQRQAEFFSKIPSAAGPTNLLRASPTACDYSSSTQMQNYLESTLIYQILGFQVEGWCGRLVFPPSRCLTFPAPRPFFCCVFPSFDPIFVPGDDNGDVTESNKLSGDCGQLLCGGIVKVGLSGGGGGGVDQSPRCKMSRGDTTTTTTTNNNNKNNNSAMTLSILDVFKQAAACLEEGLLNLLESMESHEHKSMVREAHLVFDALDNLSVVDYHSFKERVMGFIGCAVTLSELESSSPISKESCIEQEVVDKHGRLRMELEDIASQCLEASAALTASNNHFNFLVQEEARMKEMLHNIQAEILSCQAENEEMSIRLDKMNQDKHKSKLSVQVAKEEVEQAHRLRQQREAQRDVAKASFEQARSKLRERASIM